MDAWMDAGMAEGWAAIFDEGLDLLGSGADKIYICSAEPSTFAYLTTMSLGVKDFGSFGAAFDGPTVAARRS